MTPWIIFWLLSSAIGACIVLAPVLYRGRDDDQGE